MSTLCKSLLLFVLNGVDAHLTILWLRLNVATEGNALMARVLNLGEVPFLGLKLAVGAFAAHILYRSAHIPLARRGLSLVVGMYLALMTVHLATGLSALGWQAPETVLAYFSKLPGAFLALLS